MVKSSNVNHFRHNITTGWIPLTLAVVLSLFGIVLLYSTSGGYMEPWAIKQFYTLLFIIPFTILLCFMDINLIYKHSYVVYWICIALLCAAELLGHKAMGAQRWLKLGVINIQPSEYTKLAIILSLAKYFHQIHSNQVSKTTVLLYPTMMVLLPVMLVLKQPNLGTAIIIIGIAAAIYFVSGVKIWKFVLALALSVCALPIIWQFMHDYQKKRVLTFLNPQSDMLGAGYNIMQSKIAIGSGGLTGKGFLQGTQNQLNFLPENQTDFIFTLLAEEFGLIGVLIVLLLYSMLCLYCYYVALNSNNQFSRLCSIGVATMIFIHVFVNLGMISGILPVVGTPIPFLSYGGSNLITSFLGIGLVLNIKAHQHVKLLK